MNIPVLYTKYSKINDLLYMSYLPKVINVAIENNIFDILSDNRFGLTEIIEKTGFKEPVTEALLNVLVAVDLLSVEAGIYTPTGLAEEYLVKTSEANQLQAVSRFSGSSGPFDYLSAALKGDVPSFDGKIWSSKEAVLAMEQAAKAGSMQSVVEFVSTIPEFGSCTTMCDFAGSIGYYSYALLQENSNLQSYVYDLPDVCQVAMEVKQTEEDFDRVHYFDSDLKNGGSFGDGYDLFFSSHFLYEFGANGQLVDFLKKVNQSMKPGGIFVSNHICSNTVGPEDTITLSLVELQTRIMGYPTHQLSETKLKDALTEAGFGDFNVKQPDGSYAFPTLLLSAKKMGGFSS